MGGDAYMCTHTGAGVHCMRGFRLSTAVTRRPTLSWELLLHLHQNRYMGGEKLHRGCPPPSE
jgi:hypothetical protein